MIIYSYELVTSAEQEEKFLAAARNLAVEVVRFDGCASADFERELGRDHAYRFEECWTSLQAHDEQSATLDAQLMQALSASLAEKPVKRLFATNRNTRRDCRVTPNK